MVYVYKVICFDNFAISKPIKTKKFTTLNDAIMFYNLAINFNPKLYRSRDGINWDDFYKTK